jgi:hypothetical protein
MHKYGNHKLISPVFVHNCITLMMEAVHTSRTSISMRLHGATSQKAVIFIFAAMKTYQMTWSKRT